MMTEGYSSEAVSEMDAIARRFADALAKETLRVAGSYGRRFAIVDDVIAAAYVVAESKPTYIDEA